MAIDKEVQKALDQIKEDLRTLQFIKETHNKMEKQIREIRLKLKMEAESKLGLNDPGVS